MNNNILNLKRGSISEPEEEKHINGAMRRVNKICLLLNVDSSAFEPQKSIEEISKYLSHDDRIDRLLYSQISNYFSTIDLEARGKLLTNADKLAEYAYDKRNNISPDCFKIIIKLYDHIQLVSRQIENIAVQLSEGIEKSKDSVHKDIKNIEREYITILGVFASIILSFVGGITFSTSILENISEVSIYRLLLVVDFLAFILINVIYLLLIFVSKINEKNVRLYNVANLNKICAIIAILIIISWLLSAHGIGQYISSWLPWS